MFIAALTTALVALPITTKWCLRRGLVDSPNERKLQPRPVPLAGGPAILAAMFLPLLAGLALAFLLSASPGQGSVATGFPAPIKDLLQTLMAVFANRGLELATVCAGAVAMFGLGLLDDEQELRPAAKFAGQLLVALLVAAGGLRIASFVPIVSYVVTVLWIVTIVNAFNLVDNMNGLSAGLAFLGAACFVLLCAGSGNYFGALLAALACGALLGFLPHNFPAAASYLGDSGSHLAGYFMAILAILSSAQAPNHSPWALFRPLMILAIPLLDLAWVVGVRSIARRPFYVGDRNHLSHLLVRRGLSPVTAVLVLWLAAAVAGGLGLLCA
jgi:UDP-GlcNAc:undecaprenyl-phosphate GlcNAc-1-phosphate transferase